MSNTEYITQPNNLSLHWLYEKLMGVESFVRDIVSGKCERYERGQGLKRLRLSEHYIDRLKRAFMMGMHDDYAYKNPYVKLFLRACHELSAGECFLTWLMTSGISALEALNRMIDKIIALAKSDYFRSKLFTYDNWGSESFIRASRYVEELFRRSSRYTVIRLDLSYVASYTQAVDIAEAKRHLECFLHAGGADKPSVFRKLAGYVWKMEFGSDAGFHFHLVLFFKDVHGARARYWGDVLGAYWRDTITDRRGRFHNCNAVRYMHDGIGEVNRSDAAKIDVLINKVIGYVFKGSQRIPVRSGDRNFRSFGMGE